MKKIATALLISAGLVAAPVAMANQEGYVGLNVSEVEIDGGGSGSNPKPIALTVRAGAQMNDFLAAEVRLGFGVNDDKVNGVKVELENTMGAYVRGILPLNERFGVYVLGGVTRAKVKASGFGVSDSESETKVAYGLGADFSLTPEMFVNIEYARLLDGSDFDLDALSVGAGWRF
ncbi:porin family protein [Isoalcanivorax beigongshangi]|uniref:Porin family protein n=1 Tax=Isoalcanivorax beigongshangi TaxID=3238810 RepID=A0ABV4AI00_9GAMM